MTKFALPLISILVVASGVQAQSSQSENSDGVETTATTEIICRRFPPPTGSRIGPRRICNTKHQWDLIDAEARETLERAVRTRNNCDPSSPIGCGG